MILLPIIALVVGFALAFLFQIPSLGGVGGQYLALACLAGLDTICGGIRSGLEGKFHNDVFMSGFVWNVIISFFLAWFGHQIYIDLFLAIALVLGARIYTNLSLIRRYLLTKFHDARVRRQHQSAVSQVAAQPEVNS